MPRLSKLSSLREEVRTLSVSRNDLHVAQGRKLSKLLLTSVRETELFGWYRKFLM